MIQLLVIALALITASCSEHERVSASSYPSSGLYTPGSTLGASDPTDTPTEGSGLGNRCVPVPGAAVTDAGPVGTEGTLTVSYMTRTYDGFFAPDNCSAVWIETMGGAYVATIEVTAGLRRPGLVFWQDRACTEKLGPDAMTSATLSNHDKMHELTWTGRDFEGKSVPDGPYKLLIEITETDKEPGELNELDFVKGPMPFSMPIPTALEGPLKEGSVSWTVP